MANTTTTSYPPLPPLPTYELRPLPDLLPWISDFWLSLLAPHVAYWVVSGIFHLIDIYDLFPQYRLHTPEEITQRNLASRWEVARDVVLEQILQVATGAFLNLTEAKQMTGRENYDVAVWAQRIRVAQRALPGLLGLVGLNARGISEKVAMGGYPLLAGALAGGDYPFLTTELLVEGGKQAVMETVPAFAMWEMVLAKLIYWALIPAFQLWFAVALMDTWQYFWHRAMHINKWMYTNWHARHHRLYVPYAYGALYNHPVEGFVMDTLGAGIGYKLSFMTNRMGMLFFVCSTMKTVDDHCGYKLPWDPLQHITSNNAAYHDIHHQSWGIKSNFSQPFFTIWDRWLGTKWEGDVQLKYERTRAAAAAKEEKKRQEKKETAAAGTNGKVKGKVN
ncbi:fatty acid hydroxylase superfamily-domain-containing protein [Triangularia verruculosa]|uniref:Fatty acid hydroxylase superfamily-domain-containing protein n=1 Tax=Triangularia verruculosa TaxID=2587418 RepID=A0AAN7AWW7_9PEZI|nr:fatty acid hydroxylase superfamily-domain-containing protein [Triangularia verruculosa]